MPQICYGAGASSGPLLSRAGWLLLTGAQEFKRHFEDAMAHNEKSLAADEEQGESPGEGATDAETAKAEHAAKEAEADDLAGKVGQVKVSEEDDKSSQA
jgi:hypothetical protein